MHREAAVATAVMYAREVCGCTVLQNGGIIVRITNLIAITVFLTYTAALTPKRIALLETPAPPRALVVIFVVVVVIIIIRIFGRIACCVTMRKCATSTWPPRLKDGRTRP